MMAHPAPDEIDIGQLTMVPYTDSSLPVSPSRTRPARLANNDHRRRMSSISYPDLLEAKAAEKSASPRTISRSKTLPRHTQTQFPIPTELSDVPIDPTKLPSVRRWILGLVLGKYVL